MFQVTQTYFEPVLSTRLSDFTDSLHLQSLVFGILMIGYCIMGCLMPAIIKLLDPILLSSIGMLLCGTSNFLMGPSVFLPNSIILIAIGMFFSGASAIMILIPQVPIMIERTELRYPNQTRQISDI